MKLLSLDIQGFKSFANKTSIHFTDGITAIVGPNGSGKSNVIEAISWVMGETSAKSLRSDKMSDVIFAGTAKRSAVNLCQVSLTFDNSDRFLPADFDQLTISRRLSRDGQSDYFINQQSCRLKDIHELFMDSGLGRDSFSVIGQGQVDQILNNKPEERRAIFEEAAGVLKYKNRKKEAEVKLQSTKDNLDRLEDILYEIQMQRENLQLEKEKAERYLQLYDELKHKDMELTAHDIQVLHERLGSQQLAFYEAEKVSAKLDGELKKTQEDLDHLNQQISQQDSSLQELHHTLIQTVQELEQAEGQLRLLDEQERYYSKDKGRLQASLEDWQHKQSSYLQAEENYDQDLQHLVKEKKQLQQLLKEKNEDLKQMDVDQDQWLEQLKMDQFEAMREQSRLRNEQSNIEKTNQQLEARMKRVLDQWQELKVEDEQLRDQQKKLQEDYQQMEEEWTSLQEELKDLEKELAPAQDRLQKKEEELNRLGQDFQNKKAQYQSMKQMVDSYSSYYQGVQAIMKKQDKFPGIVGTVAESLQVDQTFQTAIDIALGSQSQFIIVDNDQTAQAAIEELKSLRAGRATFLPLNRIKSRFIPSQYLQKIESQEGFLGRASDLVAYDDSLAHVIENLLGQIVIAQNIDGARQLSNLLDRRFKVVSLEGDVMNVGGSMTGGAYRSSKNHKILGQNDRLDQLAKELKDLQSQGLDLKKNYNQDQNAFNQSLKELESRKEREQILKEKVNQNRYRLDQVSEDLKKATKRLQAQNFEKNAMEEEQTEQVQYGQEVDQNLVELDEKVQSIKMEMEKVQNNWDQLQLIKNEKEEERDKLKEQLAEFELKETRLVSQRDFQKDRRQEAEDKLKELEVDLEQLDQDNSLPPREAIEETLRAYKERQKRYQQEESQLRLSKEKNQDRANDLSQSIEELRQQRDSKQEELNHYQLKESQIQSKLDQLLDYLNEEYEQSYDDFQPSMDFDQLNVDQFRLAIKDLKSQIKILGPVNLSSIEDFKENDERYQFLNQQKDDLLQARDDLFSTMDEMDRQVADRFKNTFDQVQDRFAAIFPKMFNGGQAHLSLTDDTDLLHTGIDIKAQPPGKKLKSLNLLSGGERTLTAISLLFAIIQTNPIPFVILDEVEAALDDANVYRFSHYLQEFAASDIQFIVITHRKGTMEAAHRLYGISMQEKGISSVLSVHLQDAEALVENQ